VDNFFEQLKKNAIIKVYGFTKNQKNIFISFIGAGLICFERG